MNKDNPPAFPTGIITDGKGMIIGGSNGMTLRDYFAAKAMQAFISSPSLKDDADEYAVAANAYKVADAMMEARK
jgi:hypothetical protein